MRLKVAPHEETVCPYCHADDADLIQSKVGDAETATYFSTQHSLYRCDECDLYFASPLTPTLIDGLERYFADYNVIRYDRGVGHRMVMETWSRPWWRMRSARMMGQLRQIKWRAAGYSPAWGYGRCEEAMTHLFAAGARSLLDVGASYGGFVRAALDAGFDAFGVEPTRETVELIRSNGGIRVSCGLFPASHGPRDRYDALTFLHTLAYLPPPTASWFCACRDLLSPHGALLVFCSDPAHFGDSDLGSALTSPLTLSHASEKFMRRVADDCGFSSYRYSPCIGEPLCCFHILVK